MMRTWAKGFAVCLAGLLVWPASVLSAPSDSEFIRAIDSANAVQVERLLKQGANPNARDDRGEPALIYALHADRLEAADVIAAWPNTDLEAENKEGQTVLMVAAYQGRLELVKQLLDHGAEVSHSGWTALHYAASSGQIEVVRVLLDASAYLDAASPNGTTPLMMAARHKDRPVVTLLVNEGADPTPRNQSGLSAADFARKAGDEDLAVWLERSQLLWAQRHPTLASPAAPGAATADPAAPAPK
jgi:ankyrin repeat protein